MIADLVDDYPGIDAPVIASRLGEILRRTAIEFNAGRDVPIGIRAEPSATSQTRYGSSDVTPSAG